MEVVIHKGDLFKPSIIRSASILKKADVFMLSDGLPLLLCIANDNGYAKAVDLYSGDPWEIPHKMNVRIPKDCRAVVKINGEFEEEKPERG